jgi:hypothetical protein
MQSVALYELVEPNGLPIIGRKRRILTARFGDRWRNCRFHFVWTGSAWCRDISRFPLRAVRAGLPLVNLYKVAFGGFKGCAVLPGLAFHLPHECVVLQNLSGKWLRFSSHIPFACVAGFS